MSLNRNVLTLLAAIALAACGFAASAQDKPKVVATFSIHADLDPHAWQSVANVKRYVTNIRDGLIAADPAGKAAYEANAAAYLERLDALDRDVKAAIDAIPRDRRKIITSHDAFGYFQKAYGVTFVAPQGVSTEAEASAK